MNIIPIITANLNAINRQTCCNLFVDQNMQIHLPYQENNKTLFLKLEHTSAKNKKIKITRNHNLKSLHQTLIENSSLKYQKKIEELLKSQETDIQFLSEIPQIGQTVLFYSESENEYENIASQIKIVTPTFITSNHLFGNVNSTINFWDGTCSISNTSDTPINSILSNQLSNKFYSKTVLVEKNINKYLAKKGLRIPSSSSTY